MSEKPILFSTPMVKAILDGRKTMTRRVMKPQPRYDSNTGNWVVSVKGKRGFLDYTAQFYPNPYGRVGDSLWIRETWADVTNAFEDSDEIRNVAFKADDSVWNCYGQMVYLEQLYQSGIYVDKWKSPIYMPKYAARLFLEITNIRVERLQDISEKDAEKEGFTQTPVEMPSKEEMENDAFAREYAELFGGGVWTAKCHFMNKWNEINSKRGFGFSTNPFVWVIEFKMLEKSK